MPAIKKYPDELRERATRMAVEAHRDPATATDARGKRGSRGRARASAQQPDQQPDPRAGE